MPVAPVHEALKQPGPAMRVTPLPDRLDHSQLGDVPVPGDRRQAEGHGPWPWRYSPATRPGGVGDLDPVTQ